MHNPFQNGKADAYAEGRPQFPEQLYALMQLKLALSSQAIKLGGHIVFGVNKEFDFCELIKFSRKLGIEYVNQSIEQNKHAEKYHIIRFLKKQA